MSYSLQALFSNRMEGLTSIMVWPTRRSALLPPISHERTASAIKGRSHREPVMQNDDPLISEVEDLDPDPTPRKGRLDVRELLLGCLLIVMTLGWAGWQWWQQDSKESSYRMGQEAEKESRWSEARSDYAAAADYRDATTRAASV